MATLKVRIEFKPQDCWIGAFWKKTVTGRPHYSGDEHWWHDWDLWVCLLPMVPIHLSWTIRQCECP